MTTVHAFLTHKQVVKEKPAVSAVVTMIIFVVNHRPAIVSFVVLTSSILWVQTPEPVSHGIIFLRCWEERERGKKEKVLSVQSKSHLLKTLLQRDLKKN